MFHKSRISFILDEPIEDHIPDNELELLCSETNEIVDTEEYVNFDNHLFTDDIDFINCISKDEEECNSDNDSENVPITSNINDITTYKKALCEIKRLEIFALKQNNENELVQSILNVKVLIENKISNNLTKQKTLDEFLLK